MLRIVWEYFEYDLGTDNSFCQVLTNSGYGNAIKVCGACISGKFPTNLHQNLKKAHRTQYLELLVKEE